MKNLIVSVVGGSNPSTGIPFKALITANFSDVIEIPDNQLTAVKAMPDTVEVKNVIFTSDFLNRFNKSDYKLPFS